MTVGSVLTKNGFNALMNRAFSNSGTYTIPSRFKIGTGTTTPSTADTDVTTPITAWSGGIDYKNYNTAITFDTTNQKVTTQGFIASTEANGNTITEYGEFNTDDSPVMFTHTVFTSITKTSAIQAFITIRLKRI